MGRRLRRRSAARRRCGRTMPRLGAMLGWALWQQDKAAEAKAALETAVKLDPDLADARNYLGSLLMGTGGATAAEREFREAVRINPGGRGVPRQTRRRCWHPAGSDAEAAYQAKAAVEADPEFAAARLLLGQLLLASGDSPGGIRELEAAIRLKPDSGRAHYELGVALARRGNRAGAIEHLKVAAQGPDADARAAALQVLRSLGQ